MVKKLGWYAYVMGLNLVVDWYGYFKFILITWERGSRWLLYLLKIKVLKVFFHSDAIEAVLGGNQILLLIK